MLKLETSILLTGVTGLIGGEIMRGLLARGLRHIWTLIRPSGGLEIGDRLVRRMAWSSAQPDLDGSMNLAVLGDVTADRLGLQPRASETVRRDVTTIIHCAGDTSFLRGRDCHRTNVLGMHNLISFARSCPRYPLVVYVSTAASCGAVRHRRLHEEEGSRVDIEHHNEYTRSKAEAEQVLRESGLPHLILRPSIVFSAGIPNREFARDMLWFMPLLNAFDAVPVDPAGRIDAVPVSFAADSIIELLQAPGRRYDCYHISSGADHAVTCGEVARFLDNFYGRPVALKLVRPEEWTREMHRRYVRTAGQRMAFARLRYYLPFLNMDVVYDNRRLREELGSAVGSIAPLTAYLGDLLRLVSDREALAASADP